MATLLVEGSKPTLDELTILPNQPNDSTKIILMERGHLFSEGRQREDEEGPKTMEYLRKKMGWPIKQLLT
jgi:hypothetical protein